MTVLGSQSSQDDIRKNYIQSLRENNAEDVQIWLTSGAPVDIRLQKGRTPLHIATNNGQLEIVKMLLRYKANINAKDAEDFTPLHYAASRHNKEILEHLIRNGANLEAKDVKGFTPIHNALVNLKFSNVIHLMKHGAKLNNEFSLEANDEYGIKVLHWAILEGEINIAKKLLEHGADVDASIGLNCNFECHIEGEPVRSLKAMTPLHLATLLGHSDIVNILLDKDAEIEEIYQDLETPLNLAMHIGEVTLKLNSNRQFKIQIKATSNRIIVSKLLPKGNKEWKDIGKMTPLLRAASKGLVTTVTRLIYWGADVNATDETKNTALHIASRQGNLQIVKALIENHAAINVVNSNNECPLILAIQNDHQEIVDKLMANGATLNVSKLMPNNNCSLCYNLKKGTFVFQPCGHANACESCCVRLTNLEDRDLSKCPICRTDITHFQRIYL